MINFHQPIRGSSSGQLESLASWHRKCRHGGHSMPPMLKGRDIQPNKTDGISQGKLCIDWVGEIYWPFKNKPPSYVLRVVKIWRSPPGMYKPMCIVGDHINLLSRFLPSTVVQQLPWKIRFHFLLVGSTLHPATVATEGLGWDSRSPKNVKSSWWWRLCILASWGVDPRYSSFCWKCHEMIVQLKRAIWGSPKSGTPIPIHLPYHSHPLSLVVREVYWEVGVPLWGVLGYF